MDSGGSAWEGDVLDRKPAADYLHKLIQQRFKTRHSTPDSGALCIALEADWGAGKTFFLNHWANDLNAIRHPVIRFNAWANDLSEDPLLGFMAQLKSELTPLLEKLPTAPQARATAQRKLGEVLKRAPRALIPAGKLVAKGLLKNAIGADWDDTSSAFGSALNLAEQTGKELGPDALEQFFNSALQAHEDRQAAIRGLRAALEDLVAHLEEQVTIVSPVFVLIDELDRCRPDYAIRLLEGIKHLFDVRGVCFVLATNLEQLSASAQAVYGGAFDGYRYLKRFFAFEYRLPEPDHEQYALFLAKNSVLLERNLAVYSALPDVDDTSSPETLAKDFAFVARALNLDLRTQRQVFERAEAAAAGLRDNESLHAFYLFVLAAVFQRGGDLLLRIRSEGINASVLIKELRAVDINLNYQRMRGIRLEKDVISFGTILECYFRLSRVSMHDLDRQVQSLASTEYPDQLTIKVFREGGRSPQTWGREQKPSISRYPDLVLRAGLALGRR